MEGIYTFDEIHNMFRHGEINLDFFVGKYIILNNVDSRRLYDWDDIVVRYPYAVRLIKSYKKMNSDDKLKMNGDIIQFNYMELYKTYGIIKLYNKENFYSITEKGFISKSGNYDDDRYKHFKYIIDKHIMHNFINKKNRATAMSIHRRYMDSMNTLRNV